MKIQMQIAALLISFVLQAQPEEHFLSYRDGFKTEGFVDGKRLDTITAQYATIKPSSGRKIVFDYGQYRDGKKEMTVTDRQGLSLLFEDGNISFMLNFLYHNGWEVQQVVPDLNTTQNIYLMKKRKP